MGGENSVEQALQRLKQRREELDLSQAAVAETAGVNASYVGLLERGERVPSLDVLVELCKAVGLSLSEVFAAAAKNRGGETPEGEAICSIVRQWPSEHRKAALRVVREMDKLLRAKWQK